MLRAAEQVQIAPTGDSVLPQPLGSWRTGLFPLGLVCEPRRQHIVESVRKRDRLSTLAQTTCAYSADALVKRVCSGSRHKKPEHLHTPALELDVSFQEGIAVVPCIQGLSSVPERPLLSSSKEAPDLIEGSKTSGAGTGESPACKPTPDRLDPSSRDQL
jgi:hypothetical protein